MHVLMTNSISYRRFLAIESTGRKYGQLQRKSRVTVDSRAPSLRVALSKDGLSAASNIAQEHMRVLKDEIVLD